MVPALIAIDDHRDPRVAAYVGLRERDLVGREGRFIAEGEIVLRTLLGRSAFAVESVFLSEKRYPALAPALLGLPADCPVFVAPEAIMSEVVGFSIHRGVLAVGLRGRAATVEARLSAIGPGGLVVGLIGLSNHDNVGGVFRNAAAFGADAVLLDGTSCDPLYRKAIRVSVGASLVVPFAQDGSAPVIVSRLAQAGFAILALTPRGPLPLGQVTRQGRTALLLGAEGSGLPDEVLSKTQGVRIPMASGVDSLNVATASGIALHHLSAPDVRHKRTQS